MEIYMTNNREILVAITFREFSEMSLLEKSFIRLRRMRVEGKEGLLDIFIQKEFLILAEVCF